MKILNFKKIDHEKIKARFDIEFNVGTIFNFQLIVAPPKQFISYPHITYDVQGEKKRRYTYWPPKGKEADFQRKVLELLDPFIKQNAHSDDQSDDLPF